MAETCVRASEKWGGGALNTAVCMYKQEGKQKRGRKYRMTNPGIDNALYLKPRTCTDTAMQHPRFHDPLPLH